MNDCVIPIIMKLNKNPVFVRIIDQKNQLFVELPLPRALALGGRHDLLAKHIYGYNRTDLLIRHNPLNVKNNDAI